MERIKKCLDTMVTGTLGTPRNTTAEIDKWVCTQWILYKRMKINLQKGEQKPQSSWEIRKGS